MVNAGWSQKERMKTAAHLVIAMGSALIALAAVGAEGPAQSGPLQAYCVTSSATAKPGDAISIDCVLSNASPHPLILSFQGRWLGFTWTSGDKTGQTAVHMPFRGRADKSYVMLRSGDTLRQTQTFWIPRDLGGGSLQVRTSFSSKDNSGQFDYQCWTGTVATAAIQISVEKQD
jgi:hypothetical protein